MTAAAGQCRVSSGLRCTPHRPLVVRVPGERRRRPSPIRLDERYLRIWEGTRFLREAGSVQGPIHVFVDPRIVLVSRRRQAIAAHGNAWNHLPERPWRTLPLELIAARPSYVFLSRFDRRVLGQRSPELLTFLETEYRPVRALVSGRWFVNRELRKKMARESRRQRRQGSRTRD